MGKTKNEVATEEPVVGEAQRIEEEASMALALLSLGR